MMQFELKRFETEKEVTSLIPGHSYAINSSPIIASHVITVTIRKLWSCQYGMIFIDQI